MPFERPNLLYYLFSEPLILRSSILRAFSVWVGGNHSNARGKPTFQKLVAAGIPNNPPRWPEATAIVKKILRAYRDDAKDWERISDWVARIGWPRFFELTGLPFTKFHINNWKGARNSLNASTHIRF